jgi:hypothetical protein
MPPSGWYCFGTAPLPARMPLPAATITAAVRILFRPLASSSISHITPSAAVSALYLALGCHPISHLLSGSI